MVRPDLLDSMLFNAFFLLFFSPSSFRSLGSSPPLDSATKFSLIARDQCLPKGQVAAKKWFASGPVVSCLPRVSEKSSKSTQCSG